MKKTALYLLLCLLCVSVFSLNLFAQEEDDDAFTIALTGKYPPFSFYSSDGKLVGFDVDVSREVAKKMGKELEIVTTEWDGILAGLLSGRYDAIIGSMAITPERAEKVNFSIPYYISGAQLFVHKDREEEITDASDLKNGKVGVVLGTTFEHYLTNNFPEMNVVTYKGEVDIYQDMLNDRLDGFVTDRLVGMYQIKQAEMPFVPAGPLLYEERMAIPVEKDRTVLLSNINDALRKMQADGTFQELREKWFGEKRTEAVQTGMSNKTIAANLIRGFGVTLLIAVFSLLIGFILALPTAIILNRSRGILNAILRVVVDFVRGTPVLIQLFFVYFSAPQVGIRLSPLQSAIITLSINAASYMAEVIRAGLMSVPRGQKLAGRALGLNKYQVFRLIVWPQAFRIAIPPLMNSAVALMKDTALVSVISVAEVIREAQSIISVTYDPMKYYFIVAVMFFIFTFPLMKLSGIVEKKIKSKGFKSA